MEAVAGRAKMSDNTITVTDATLAETVASSTPTIVDFWAEWCGPCKMLSPILDEIAREYDGRVTIAKLNVDDHPQAGIDYGVQSIPTMIIFKDGVAKKRIVGARPKAAIVGDLEEYLS